MTDLFIGSWVQVIKVIEPIDPEDTTLVPGQYVQFLSLKPPIAFVGVKGLYTLSAVAGAIKE